MFASGVPLNTPLENERPLGKTPTRAQVSTEPPDTLGVRTDMVVSRISVRLSGE